MRAASGAVDEPAPGAAIGAGGRVTSRIGPLFTARPGRPRVSPSWCPGSIVVARSRTDRHDYQRHAIRHRIGPPIARSGLNRLILEPASVARSRLTGAPIAYRNAARPVWPERYESSTTIDSRVDTAERSRRDT
jgi:hypothetical protein